MKKKEKIRKRPTIKVGLRNKLRVCFWVLFISAFGFVVIRSFTLTHTHTVTEKQMVQEVLVDTNSIENFVSNFARTYYAWDMNSEIIEKRTENLKNYLTEELQQLNSDSVLSDIPTKSEVRAVRIYGVEQIDENHFDVLFMVIQGITENQTAQKNIQTAFTVRVYVDELGNMVIVKNPTIDTIPEKSQFSPTPLESDNSVATEDMKEIEEFLNTFFKLYPKADQKELNYYAKEGVLKPINKNYVFDSLINPVYRTIDGEIIVNVTARYLDEETKQIQFAQFELTLQRINENWQIVK